MGHLASLQSHVEAAFSWSMSSHFRRTNHRHAVHKPLQALCRRGDDAVFIGLHSTRRALQSTQQQRLGEQQPPLRELRSVVCQRTYSSPAGSRRLLSLVSGSLLSFGSRPCATPAARGNRRRGCRRLLLGRRVAQAPHRRRVRFRLLFRWRLGRFSVGRRRLCGLQSCGGCGGFLGSRGNVDLNRKPESKAAVGQSLRARHTRIAQGRSWARTFDH